jgi:endoglucanase
MCDAVRSMQICYVMGASGRSYVVGFGCNPPKNPHHRGAALARSESGRWDIFDSRKVNANEITGAMVGGPNAKDEWVDDRKDYQRNEVAVDFNGALLLGTVQVAR